MRTLIAATLLLVPALALGQGAPAAPAPAAPMESEDIKHDQGIVRTVDAQRGVAICDCPSGPVTYDISQAQLFDAEGKPAGLAAANLKTGDKVRVTYTVQPDNTKPSPGAHASEVRIVK
jgi:hypothetical protein